jgi:hypothetical protein
MKHGWPLWSSNSSSVRPVTHESPSKGYVHSEFNYKLMALMVRIRAVRQSGSGGFTEQMGGGKHFQLGVKNSPQGSIRSPRTSARIHFLVIVSSGYSSRLIRHDFSIESRFTKTTYAPSTRGGPPHTTPGGRTKDNATSMRRGFLRCRPSLCVSQQYFFCLRRWRTVTLKVLYGARSG